MPVPSDAEQLLLRLEWTIIRRLDGLLHGDYRSFFRGPGLDLADLREYQYHDDVRHIDWNVTARMQTPYVREFNEDRDLTAWFLLDLSASLDFGSRVQKQAVSAEFVGVLARPNPALPVSVINPLYNVGAWQLKGVVDMDGDGTSDLLWQSPDGWTGGWFMQTNGAARDARGWWNTAPWTLRAGGR